MDVIAAPTFRLPVRNTKDTRSPVRSWQIGLSTVEASNTRKMFALVVYDQLSRRVLQVTPFKSCPVGHEVLWELDDLIGLHGVPEEISDLSGLYIDEGLSLWGRKHSIGIPERQGSHVQMGRIMSKLHSWLDRDELSDVGCARDEMARFCRRFNRRQRRKELAKPYRRDEGLREMCRRIIESTRVGDTN